MKICYRCSVEKPLEDFYKRIASKDNRQCYCKACANQRVKDYRRERKNWLKQIKGSSCYICGEKHNHSDMDFHHLEPKEKEINVSTAVSKNWSLTRLKKEINKCIIVCRPCHRQIHKEMRNGN